MAEPIPKKTAFDNEFDNDSWSQKEISLSSKVLIALGGITSFGGMIPLIITKISDVDEDFTVTPLFFVIFTLFYFVGPLVILYFWNYLTNRVVKPAEKPKSWEVFKSSPITYRFSRLIVLHMFLTAIYLVISIVSEHIYIILISAILLLISSSIAVGSFTNRAYKAKKIKPLHVHILFGLILIAFVVIGCFFYQDISQYENENDKLENSDYEKIAYVEETSSRLTYIENDIANEADRFYILSGMNAWNLLNKQMTSFEDSVDLSAFKIDQAISVFNNYIINDKKISIEPICDDYLLQKLYDKNVIYNCTSEEGSTKPKFFIPHNPFCKKHHKPNINSQFVDSRENQVILGDYFNQLFIKTSANDSILKEVLKTTSNQYIDTSGIDFKMGMVNGHIDTMLALDRHRLYPSCFSHLVIPSILSDTSTKYDTLYTTNYFNEIVKPLKATFYYDSLRYHGIIKDSCDNLIIPLKQAFYFDKIVLSQGDSNALDTLMALRIDKSLKAKLAATMNRYNSRELKEWIEQMYLPYAQRKAAQEIEIIADETAWIWKEIKYIGIFISVATLFLLSLNYLELNDLKAFIVASEFNSATSKISPENQSIMKDRVADLNQKSSYLLFPLTTTITIVAILLIPVTTKTEVANIEPTKSFRMLQVPSIKLPKAVESSVNIEDRNQKETEITSLVQEMNKLAFEIDELTKALNKLGETNGDPGNFPDNEGFKESQAKQTEELKQGISELSKELNLIKKQLELMKKELDKTKRR